MITETEDPIQLFKEVKKNKYLNQIKFMITNIINSNAK